MKLVVTGDWHGDWSTIGVPRFFEIREATMNVTNRAIEEKRRSDDVAFVFLGDLADPDSGGATFRAIELMHDVIVCLVRHEVTSILIAGNHDTCDDGSGCTTLTPLRPLESNLVHIVEGPRIVESVLGDFLALPYTSPSHPYDPVEWCGIAATRGVRAVFGHLMIPGIVAGTETTDMPRGRDVLFPYAEASSLGCPLFNGHYHRAQAFAPEGGVRPIMIPGSLARLGFGEEDNEPGFIVATAS